MQLAIQLPSLYKRLPSTPTATPFPLSRPLSHPRACSFRLPPPRPCAPSVNHPPAPLLPHTVTPLRPQLAPVTAAACGCSVCPICSLCSCCSSRAS
ncbi:unnamed protein product [Closterium sp. NIES-53]